ncbi:PaaI family thioesterase [Aquihabitans sp. McL0605]|uniref:PaaI family thioesterase n=1 Tax=Aquihabitans sp. McL0605 TaxID=3415671 RepID=UPI003CFAD527
MTVPERQQVASQLRALADRLATDDLDEAGWAHVSRSLQAAQDAFPAEPTERTRFARGFVDAAHHPIPEATSGVYPPLELEEHDGRLIGHVRFGPAWEGPPDMVHGGYLAAGFDMVLSTMAHRLLGHSVTRRLHVRYLKPTFWGAPLRYEVEADAPQGRLLELRGTLLADGKVTMRASAQFASVDVERFADRRPPA